MARIKIIAGALVAAALFSASVPAGAETANMEKVSVLVEHNDLDLSKASGQERLQGRIRSAVRKVCGTVDSRDVGARKTASECQQQAMGKASRDAEVAIARYNDGHQLAARESAIVGN